MRYKCFTEYCESEDLSLSEIFYEIKENRLIEISLDNWYAIRQWKDIDVEYEDNDNWKFNMTYGTVYCTRGNNIESVREWWWEADLKEFIKTCQNYI